MSCQPSCSDLPIIFHEVTVWAGRAAILNRVSLSILPGGPTVVIGPNGSGKTTFLRAAMGLIAPGSGRVTWGGRSTSSVRRRAIVFQRPVMLRRSVIGNLQYALAAAGAPRREHAARIPELLELVGLSGLESRPARRLSGGEQQRLALARALARDPAVLFLDEPAASLDPAASQTIENIVRTTAARGVKIVMTTHDLAEARRLATEIVLLNHGSVIEIGPADRFFTSPMTEEARRFVAGELLV